MCVCVLLVYLQRLEEAKGAQSSAAGHQTEGGVVEHLLVVIPAETQHINTHDDFTDIKRAVCSEKLVYSEEYGK